MGPYKIIVAVFLLALVPTGIAAQSNDPGSLQDFRLDPSRDTNQPRPPERAGPDIDNRPPPIVALPDSEPLPPPVTNTVTPAPAPDQQPRSQTPSALPARETRPVDQSDAPPDVSVPTVNPPPAVPATDTADPPAQAAVTPPTERPSYSPTFIILLVLAAMISFALAGAWWVRRRRRDPDETMATEADDRPMETPQSVLPVVRDAAATAMQTDAPVPRAWVAIAFEPLNARTTLMGAAVGYRLSLHNKGPVAAHDIIIGAFIANADARQPDALASFSAAPIDTPLHSVAMLAAGSTIQLSGELRLGHDALAPIEVHGRSLLIPLVAFKVRYDCGDGEVGQTFASFIVGQESTPPRPRMQPFRLDQGPRQYRDIGSRPVQDARLT